MTPKKNPKHQSRKYQKKLIIRKNKVEKRISPKDDFEIPSNPFSNLSVEELNEMMDISKGLAEFSRKTRINIELNDWYSEIINSIHPNITEDYIQLNQQEFHEFIKFLKKKFVITIRDYMQNECIDYTLQHFYLQYHEFKLVSRTRFFFYLGIKYILGNYTNFDLDYENSFDNYDEQSRNKICFKNFFTFEEMIHCFEILNDFETIFDFIFSVQLINPHSIDPIENSIGGVEELIKRFIKSIEFLPSYLEDLKNYQFRIGLVRNPAWSSASFLERTYFNMVFAGSDENVENLDKISVGYMYNALKAFESELLNRNLNCLETASIIGAFFNLFNKLTIGRKTKANLNEPFFVIVSKEKDYENWLIPYFETIYNTGLSLYPYYSTSIDYKNKLKHFLQVFSITPEEIDIEKDLFSQDKIPFAIQFQRNCFYISSIQFLTAFGELIFRFGINSGRYVNYKGKLFEEHIKQALYSITTKICTRIKLTNIQIGDKNQTDIDVSAIYKDILFIMECKAYSRVNYKKKLELETIEQNIEDLNIWLADIDNIANWGRDKKNLQLIIEKMNSKLKKKDKVELTDIKFIIPCVITVAPEFLLEAYSIGWLDEENKIPRCCTMREILAIFNRMHEKSDFLQVLRNQNYTVQI